MISFLSIALLLSDLPAGASRHVTPLASEIRLELRIESSDLVVGDRVVMHIVATSTALHPITALLPLHPLLGSMAIKYRVDGGPFLPVNLFSQYGEFSSGSGPIVLQPGRVVEHVAAFSVTTPYVRPFSYLLGTPGVYEFGATLADTPNDPNGVVFSKPMMVTVGAVPANETVAFAAYSPELAQLSDFSPMWPVPEGVPAAAEAFIAAFPDSRYAANAREGLRRYLLSFIRTARATDAQLALYQRLFGGGDDARPPVLALAPGPLVLWPPNRQLTPVFVNITATDDSGVPAVTLISIACDDSCDPVRDIAEAAFGTDDRTFKLRADRTGGGKGRTYTIVYEATNAAGRKTRATTIVTVPHDRGKN